MTISKPFVGKAFKKGGRSAPRRVKLGLQALIDHVAQVVSIEIGHHHAVGAVVTDITGRFQSCRGHTAIQAIGIEWRKAGRSKSMCGWW